VLNRDSNVVAQLALEQSGLLVFDIPVAAQYGSNALA
jgi:hypothetical protein